MKTTAEERGLIPNMKELASKFRNMKVTVDNLDPAPGMVICRVPPLSTEILTPTLSTPDDPEGEGRAINMSRHEMRRPVEVLKIGPNPFSEMAGQYLKNPWFQVGDWVYTTGSWVNFYESWKDAGLIMIGRDDIVCRYKS